MNLFATYAGTVESIDDPDRLGRIKARVQAVYGPVAGAGISTEEIPWALPSGLPAGGSSESGAIAWLPNIGDRVWVRFLDGEPEKPIWEWANQTASQAVDYPVWRRSPGGYDGEIAPRSAFLTRYGHSIDFQPDEFTFRTARGYKIRFTDSTGQLDVYARSLVGLMESVNVTSVDFAFNAIAGYAVDAGTVDFSSNTFDVESMTNTIVGILSSKIQSPQVELGPAGFAVDPVVRLSDLQLVVNALLLQFNKHIHLDSLKKPTTPPIAPMVLVPTASKVTFTA